MQLTVQKPQSSGYGTAIICFILAIVAFFFLLLPKYSAYKDAKAMANNSQASLEEIKQEQQAVNDLLAKLKAKSSDLQKVDMALPNNASIPDFYAYIESLAKSVNLNISTIQAKDETETPSASATPNPTGVTPAAAGTAAASQVKTLSPTIGKISMDLQLTGTLESYTSFLAKLQNSLRLIDVQSVNIAAAEGKSDLTFITNLASYYQKSK